MPKLQKDPIVRIRRHPRQLERKRLGDFISDGEKDSTLAGSCRLSYGVSWPAEANYALYPSFLYNNNRNNK